jgi:hypothetical protein
MAFFAVLFVILVVFMYFTTKSLLSKMKEVEKSLGVKYKLVSAGSMKKRKEAYVWLPKTFREESFVLDGKTIDKSKYTPFVVDGKSMQRFGIENGDIVLVDERKNPPVTETSIFVLNVFPPKRGKIEYKLRKPIGLYDCRDFSEENFRNWAEEHSWLDTGNLKQDFVNTDIREKIDECKRHKCNLLVSETTRKGKIYYSFHPADRIFGTVEHVIENENIEIIEKR